MRRRMERIVLGAVMTVAAWGAERWLLRVLKRRAVPHRAHPPTAPGPALGGGGGGGAAPRAPPRDEPLHHLGVEDGTAGRHLAERPDDLLDIGDPLLQQVAEPLGTVLEELVRVLLLGVLREHHHAGARVLP